MKYKVGMQFTNNSGEWIEIIKIENGSPFPYITSLNIKSSWSEDFLDKHFTLTKEYIWTEELKQIINEE